MMSSRTFVTGAHVFGALYITFKVEFSPILRRMARGRGSLWCLGIGVTGNVDVGIAEKTTLEEVQST
jgi:hypothetical protein